MPKKLDIAHALARADVSQQELAIALGVSAAAVCEWVSARKQPMANRLPDIARICGCSVDALYTIVPDGRGKHHEEA